MSFGGWYVAGCCPPLQGEREVTLKAITLVLLIAIVACGCSAAPTPKWEFETPAPTPRLFPATPIPLPVEYPVGVPLRGTGPSGGLMPVTPTPTPAPTPAPTPRWAPQSTPTPPGPFHWSAREFASRFVWCIQFPQVWADLENPNPDAAYNQDYRIWLEDPMLVLDEWDEAGGITGREMWDHLWDSVNPLVSMQSPTQVRENLSGHPFNSGRFDHCSRVMLFGEERYPYNFPDLLKAGYIEVLCENRAEWQEGRGYESLRGWILQHMYRTELAMLYQGMGNRVTGTAVPVEEGCKEISA